MKLFNNLRQRIVHKLIRPEDGYTFTGNAMRFYCDLEDAYVLFTGRRYICPTLAGWKEYDYDETNLDEINFDTWVVGILNNINDQYMDRLECLAQDGLGSLQDYRLAESGEKFVITKKSFCDIVEALESYWINLRALEGILDVYFEQGMMMDIIDKVVDALEKELEPQFYDPELDFNIDENPLIMQWLTGGERERTVNNRVLKTAEDLYDYLVEKRENNLEKSSKTS